MQTCLPRDYKQNHSAKGSLLMATSQFRNIGKCQKMTSWLFQLFQQTWLQNEYVCFMVCCKGFAPPYTIYRYLQYLSQELGRRTQWGQSALMWNTNSVNLSTQPAHASTSERSPAIAAEIHCRASKHIDLLWAKRQICALLGLMGLAAIWQSSVKAIWGTHTVPRSGAFGGELGEGLWQKAKEH